MAGIDHVAVRAAVDAHIKANPPSVVKGDSWMHGTADAMKAVKPKKTKWLEFVDLHLNRSRNACTRNFPLLISLRKAISRCSIQSSPMRPRSRAFT